MARRPIRAPREGRPLFDPFSLARRGAMVSGGFTRAQIEQIARTVRRTPEVMVKVTGGGSTIGAVAAHLAYIGRKGALEIESDDGRRVTGREEQRALLKDWHLELTAGQYRRPGTGQKSARASKLVYNIVLSMPAPTPPAKVLAAARNFTREKFGVRHRYLMVLHTDQAHPHVHVVVKAEDEQGRRLHVDKPMLRQWREDFAREMRAQGVAANATPRVVRGRSTGKTKDVIYRVQQRGALRVVRERVLTIAREFQSTGTFADPARERLLRTRKSVVASWTRTAELLDAQGEIELAGEVRYFARHLPPVLTDKERMAARFVQQLDVNRRLAGRTTEDARQRQLDLAG